MTLDPSTITLVRRAALAFAVMAVLLSAFGRRFSILQYRPGGSSFDTIIRPIFLGIFVVALLLSFRWEIAGGLIAAFAAAGLVAFSTQQLITLHSVLVVAAFAIPAALWILIDLHVLSGSKAALVVIAALAVSGAGFAGGTYAYNRTWGPTHPESTTPALPDSALRWVWSGNVTPTSASVRAKPAQPFEMARIAVDTDPALDGPTWHQMADKTELVAAFDLRNLTPATTYHYAVEVDGVLDTTRAGQFTTFPDGASSFTVAFGACARVGSNGRVFDQLATLDPLLYMVIGDFHYGDNFADNLDAYRKVLDLTLEQPGQSALYRSVPVAYVWDDHDYGANDSNALSLSRVSAMASYREYVPSYPLAGPTSPVYQSFTIGRVRFVMTDARAGRDEQSKFDDDQKSMLGRDQKDWLKEELLAGSAEQELVVWVNPVPWVAETKAGADNWAGYNTERKELANFIADNDIDNLVMISGDAHMVAIDDGTNTNFSDEPGPAFPLLHAAALDRPGGIKGGPYSEGAIAGGGQFGTIEVIDEGGPLEVVLRAIDWTGALLIEHRFKVAPVTPQS